MTQEEQLQFNRMYSTLRRICNDYKTSEQIREDCEGSVCLDFEEEIEAQYDNIQVEALFAIQGVSLI